MSFQKILTAISFGMALHYTEIQKAWEVCGSDILCKAEKILLNMTGILGIASPSVALSSVTKTLVNKAWMWAKGHPLLDKNSYWGPTLISLGIYSTMEHYLSYGVDFVSYATDCLKSGTCEGYDVLIWIGNMKIQYCNKTDLSPSSTMQLECVEGDQDQNCDQVDDQGLLGRIQNRSDLCVAFFNELPLLSSAAFTWVAYLVTLGWQRDNEDENDEDGNDGGDGDGNDGGDGDGNDGGDGDGNDGGDGDGNDGGDGDGNDGGDGDGNGNRKDGDDSDNQDDCTKTPPSVPPKKTPPPVPPKKTQQKTKDKPTATQSIHVTCPFCNLSKRACIPKPLSIFCPDCGKNIKSNKDLATQQKTEAGDVNPNSNKSNYSTPRNLFPSENVSEGVASTVQTPTLPSTLNISCHEEKEKSKECTFTLSAENNESDSDSHDDDISDDEELYDTYMTLAMDHKDELKASLGYLHADHVHENAQINETLERSASHYSDSDDTEEEDFY